MREGTRAYECVDKVGEITTCVGEIVVTASHRRAGGGTLLTETSGRSTRSTRSTSRLSDIAAEIRRGQSDRDS